MKNESLLCANQPTTESDIYKQIVLNAALKFAAEYMVNHILSEAPFSEKNVRLAVTAAMSAAMLAYEFSFIGLAIAAATIIATRRSRNESQFMQSCFFMFSLCTKFSPLNLIASSAANKVGDMLLHCMWQHDGLGVKHHGVLSAKEQDEDDASVAAFVRKCNKQ